MGDATENRTMGDDRLRLAARDRPPEPCRLLSDRPAGRERPGEAGGQPASQTLLRGLDVLDRVADGPVSLSELSVALGLTRSTTHRLAAGLMTRGLLTRDVRSGYALGPRLLQLGQAALEQNDLTRAARPWLDHLTSVTCDTARLAIRRGDHAICLDVRLGRRTLIASGRVGDALDLVTSALGKALVLGEPQAALSGLVATRPMRPSDSLGWLERMGGYALAGHAFDLGENGEGLRCVAAPVRGPDGFTIAAVGVSAASLYMPDGRMDLVARQVRDAAEAISRELGSGAANRNTRETQNAA